MAKIPAVKTPAATSNGHKVPALKTAAAKPAAKPASKAVAKPASKAATKPATKVASTPKCSFVATRPSTTAPSWARWVGCRKPESVTLA